MEDILAELSAKIEKAVEKINVMKTEQDRLIEENKGLSSKNQEQTEKIALLEKNGHEMAGNFKEQMNKFSERLSETIKKLDNVF